MLTHYLLAVRSSVLSAQFGVGYIVLISLVTWISHFTFTFLTFPLYMRRIGYPSTHSWRLVYFLRPRISHDLFIGSLWFIKQNYITAIIITAEILFISYARALYNKNAIEFARGGALVVAVSLLLLLLDFLEGYMIKIRWEGSIVSGAPFQGKQIENMKEISSDLVNKAHFRAICVTIIVSSVGTMVWGFGDQSLACWSFPALHHIKDKSGVACFVSSAGEPEYKPSEPEYEPLASGLLPYFSHQIFPDKQLANKIWELNSVLPLQPVVRYVPPIRARPKVARHYHQ